MRSSEDKRAPFQRLLRPLRYQSLSSGSINSPFAARPSTSLSVPWAQFLSRGPEAGVVLARASCGRPADPWRPRTRRSTWTAPRWGSGRCGRHCGCPGHCHTARGVSSEGFSLGVGPVKAGNSPLRGRSTEATAACCSSTLCFRTVRNVKARRNDSVAFDDSLCMCRRVSVCLSLCLFLCLCLSIGPSQGVLVRPRRRTSIKYYCFILVKYQDQFPGID